MFLCSDFSIQHSFMKYAMIILFRFSEGDYSSSFLLFSEKTVSQMYIHLSRLRHELRIRNRNKKIRKTKDVEAGVKSIGNKAKRERKKNEGKLVVKRVQSNRKTIRKGKRRVLNRKAEEGDEDPKYVCPDCGKNFSYECNTKIWLPFLSSL